MLKKINQLRNNHEEGFTLVELIVVIVIIGILAAIAVPMYLNNRKQAIDAQTKSNTDTIAKAMSKQFYETPDAEDFFTQDTSRQKSTESGANNGWIGERFNDGTEFIAAQIPHSGYCVIAWNQSGGDYTEKSDAFIFDSTLGGITSNASQECMDYINTSNPTNPTNPSNKNCEEYRFKGGSATPPGVEGMYLLFTIRDSNPFTAGGTFDLINPNGDAITDPTIVVTANKTGQIVGSGARITVGDNSVYFHYEASNYKVDDYAKALKDGSVTITMTAKTSDGRNHSVTKVIDLANDFVKNLVCFDEPVPPTLD